MFIADSRVHLVRTITIRGAILVKKKEISTFYGGRVCKMLRFDDMRGRGLKNLANRKKVN